MRTCERKGAVSAHESNDHPKDQAFNSKPTSDLGQRSLMRIIHRNTLLHASRAACSRTLISCPRVPIRHIGFLLALEIEPASHAEERSVHPKCVWIRIKKAIAD